MQSNIEIGEDSITGTLKWVENYTGFSDDPALQSGNYIALHASVPEFEDAEITVTVTDPVVLGDDGLAVLRIADKDTQTITVTATVEGYDDVTREFTLDELWNQEYINDNLSEVINDNLNNGIMSEE